MSGFASIGECMIELSGGEGDQWRMGFAGDTLNTAWYVRALTDRAFPVDYVSAFGEDNFSQKQRVFFSSNGIGIAHSPVIAGVHPGLYAITLSGAERSFTYWRSDAAARRLASDRAALEQSLSGRDIIYFSGISIAIVLPEHRETFFDVLRQCRAAGSRIAFDPNFRHQLWPDRKAAQEIISEAMRLADIALPTFPDEQALFGDTNAEACAERLISLGVKEVVVKDGTEPALVAAGGEQTLVPAVFANAVDTTGAGDSFNGAYLVARMEGLSPVEAAQKAHAVAARVVETRGALTPMETARAAYAG
ncbi:MULTISPECIES: sugar kinase [Ochrobactrum]|uniref:Sugar kinase n=1 Tax=Ochrobactrum teleogrylli TaxID=2479765 RepID=A0ABY2Y4G2_9HYPH|nr:sugar kinase [[Ochrobactrum] teleogrylli]MCI0999701.1 sugar kinase [Ochrobactrum sp. C6C9]TNV15009.1 sugar kinase [[Ochrobactrum] teleogrylli]